MLFRSMMQTVIMGVVNIIFTLVAIFTVDRFGRKPLLIIGSIGMAVGAFAVAMCDSMAIKGVLPVLSIIVYAAFFMMSWGPICWVLISEIFPNTIRGKAVAIAVAFQWIFNYIVSCISTKDAGNLRVRDDGCGRDRNVLASARRNISSRLRFLGFVVITGGDKKVMFNYSEFLNIHGWDLES